jgi:hypothetical protein
MSVFRLIAITLLSFYLCGFIGWGSAAFAMSIRRPRNNRVSLFYDLFVRVLISLYFAFFWPFVLNDVMKAVLAFY